MSNRRRHRFEGFRMLDWRAMEDHYRDMASRGIWDSHSGREWCRKE